MKVAAVQHDVTWEDRDATLRHIEPMVGAAVERGARLVVLPEMFAVGFSMDPERVAEPDPDDGLLPGSTTRSSPRRPGGTCSFDREGALSACARARRSGPLCDVARHRPRGWPEVC